MYFAQIFEYLPMYLLIEVYKVTIQAFQQEIKLTLLLLNLVKTMIAFCLEIQFSHL